MVTTLPTDEFLTYCYGSNIDLDRINEYLSREEISDGTLEKGMIRLADTGNFDSIFIMLEARPHLSISIEGDYIFSKICAHWSLEQIKDLLVQYPSIDVHCGTHQKYPPQFSHKYYGGTYDGNRDLAFYEACCGQANWRIRNKRPSKENQRIAKWLNEYGGDVNPNVVHITFIDLVDQGNTDMVLWMLKKFPWVNTNITINLAFLQVCRNYNPTMIRLMQTLNIKLDWMQINDGFQDIVEWNDEEMVDWFAELYGDDINYDDAFERALDHCLFDMCDHLLEVYNVYFRWKEDRLFMLACMVNNLEVAQYLQSKCSEYIINVEDNNIVSYGVTGQALHVN